MTLVRFDGWNEGFAKVARNRLLRKHTELGLRETKNVVDRVLSGESVVVNARSQEDATVLIRDSTAIGARCVIVTGRATHGPGVR